ncbi:MAG: response regulator [Spirochaetota bacterium]|nr:response regulator [Spirochaetota bacterium]
MSSNIYKILIVEDEETQLFLIESILNKCNLPNVKFSIQKAKSYDMAVGSIKSDFPDLVLLDINLIGLSGLYVAAYITAHAINHDLVQPKIIFISGLLEEKDKIINKAKLLGAIFLWKPLDTNVLKELVVKFVINKYPEKPLIAKEVVHDGIDPFIKKFTKENVMLIRDLEHYVAHLIMELQYFRTKSKDMFFGTEEEQFLDEMSEIESKTLDTFEKFKKEFVDLIKLVDK